ncbi:MAG: hypothetical protein WDA27_10240, partial [Actinomycetota bacterium]
KPTTDFKDLIAANAHQDRADAALPVQRPTRGHYFRSVLARGEAPDVPPVATTTSDARGRFAVSLAPGTYSVFVEDEGKPFCRRSDGEGNACPHQVEDSAPTWTELVIDHASY